MRYTPDMVVPIPRPIASLAPWEVRFRTEGARLVLEPVLWSPRLIRELVLLTVLTSAAGALGMLILGAAGERRFLFIPPSLAGFMWLIGTLTTYLGRREQAEGGPLCIIDPADRSVEIPREHLVLRNAQVQSLHLVTFRVAHFPPRPRQTVQSGRQLLAIIAQDGHPPRPIPLATGRLAATVPSEAHALARALGITLELHDAPDQAPEGWP